MKYCPVCNNKYDDSLSFCTRDGEVLQEDVTAFVGSTLDGQYHIEALVGKGGMGAVYRARHILLGDRVAIKILPSQMRSNAEWLKRFRREGQAARRFRHPNAVTVYDLRTTNDGLVYMVMEYVEGHTLNQELRARGRFTPHDAFAILEPVMNALHAAHAVGVVHRDLKPENIMIGPAQTGSDITIKILDMGIAKMLADAESGDATMALTVAGQILGTPYYMSPEQWGELPRDGNSEIDGRADIYSLAAVFYELISGARPFVGLTVPELRREHLSIMPRSLREVALDVPEAFSRAIMRALSKDRSDRQATVGEFAQELRASLGLAPNESVRASTPIGTLPNANQQVGVTTKANVNDILSPLKTEGLNAKEISSTGSVQGSTIVEPSSEPPPPSPYSTTPSNPQIPPTVSHQFIQLPPELQQFQSNSGQSADNQLSVPLHSHPLSLQPSHEELPPTSAGSVETFGIGVSEVSQPNIIAPAPVIGSAPMPTGQPAQTPQKRKSVSKAWLLIPLLGLIILVLAGAVGIGGYIFWDKIWPSQNTNVNINSNTNTNVNANTNVNNNTSPELPAAGPEVMRCWLEVLKSKDAATVRMAQETTPLESGQSFKFHFTSQSDGYLYIVGTGHGEASTTFLTAKPISQLGVTTNRLTKSVEYVLPQGGGNWFTLDENVGLEKYTIVFSPTALTTPTFFTTEAGKLLNVTERKEFEDFLEKHKANAPTLHVNASVKNEPFISIKASKSSDGAPLVFNILIDHR